MTLDASDPAFYAETNRPAYLRIHRDDPVYWVDARHTQPFWNVCRHDLIREVGQEGELFTTEFGVHLNAAAFEVKSSAGMVAALPVALRPANVMDAEGHRRLRNPVNPHFTTLATGHSAKGASRTSIGNDAYRVIQRARPRGTARPSAFQ